MVPGAFSLSATAVNEHTHSPFTLVVSMDSSQVGSRMETLTLPVRPEESTMYPSARLPSTGVLIGMDDANLTCQSVLFTLISFACIRPLSTSHFVHYPHPHLLPRVMERVFHHVTFGRQCLTIGFFPGADGEFCEAERHGRHQFFRDDNGCYWCCTSIGMSTCHVGSQR